MNASTNYVKSNDRLNPLVAACGMFTIGDDPAAARPGAPDGTNTAPPLHGVMLLIEDEKSVRDMLSRALRYFGLDVLAAENATSGIALCRKHYDAISCVLLDHAMPGITGDQTLLAIRQINPDVPIIMMSGYNHTGLLEQTGSPGIAGFLHKPFRLVDLHKLLCGMLAPA